MVFKFLLRVLPFAVIISVACLVHVQGQNKSELPRVSIVDIPGKTLLTGVLSEPLCTYLRIEGEWIVQYDRYEKSECLHFKVLRVNSRVLVAPPVISIRCIGFQYQTMYALPEDVTPTIKVGDKWIATGYETGVMQWTPSEVYRLPGVVAWNDGRPRTFESHLMFVTSDRFPQRGGE